MPELEKKLKRLAEWIYRQPTIDEIDAVLADYVKRVQQTDPDFTGTNGKIIQTTEKFNSMLRELSQKGLM
jgi:hypothetical protein